jgi:serine-type D-Ala-D-Ala carboxypeptidase (penicillin-binding protein 5/6)
MLSSCVVRDEGWIRMGGGPVSRRGVLGMAVSGLTVAGLAATGLDAPAARAEVTAAGPSGVLAPYAYLGDATGVDLWSRSSAVPRPMGSITKVMTAYVVIRANKLNQVIAVPQGIVSYDTDHDASTAGLVPGEKLTTRDLLIALLLPSGCDAAYTLAAAYGPGTSRFVAAMNAAATSLGLTHTHFTDFSGLPIPGEYSTYSSAGNLVTLGRAAMRLPAFRQIVAMASYRLPAGNGHLAHSWHNLNPLIGHYPGAIGIKTGYTSAAGDCLLFEAIQTGKTLTGVVLHSSSSSTGLDVATSDAEKMLNWGFAHYR